MESCAGCQYKTISSVPFIPSIDTQWKREGKGGGKQQGGKKSNTRIKGREEKGGGWMDRQSLKGHMASNVRRERQRQSHASGMHREGRSSRCPWAGLLLFPSKFVVQVSASEDPFLGFSFLSPSSVSLSGEQHRTAWRRIKTMVVPLHLVGLCALCPTSPTFKGCEDRAQGLTHFRQVLYH